MNVKIWDIKKKTWFEMLNIKHIYQSITGEYFTLDSREFKTSDYNLNFIHSEA